MSALTEELHHHRPYLLAVAYNILGERSEAEDIVQDSVEYLLTLPPDHVHNLKSYLTRVVANKAIDRLKALKKEREQYPGVWLPEPYVQPDEPLIDSPAESTVLSYELLCALEQLNPIERAVFILREGFDLSYQELSHVCDTTETNCRQLLSRARKKVRGTTPTNPPNPETHQRLIAAFLQACDEENPEALTQLLREDIVLYSDGGGKVAAAMVPLRGTAVVTKFLVGIVRKARAQRFSYRLVKINGQGGVLLSLDDTPDTLIAFNTNEGSIQQLFMVRNPDKFFLPLLSQNQ